MEPYHIKHQDTAITSSTDNARHCNGYVLQNTVMWIATGCTPDTNTQYLHDENKVLLMDT